MMMDGETKLLTNSSVASVLPESTTTFIGHLQQRR
jgi:hypothetical protein